MSNATERKMQRKLAICVMCVDDLPFEDVWRRWASRLEEVEITVSFFIHSHHRKNVSEWMSERLAPEAFDTKWGSIDLVRAAIALLETAMKKDSFDYFAFCSETCLPISTAKDVEDELYSPSSSPGASWIRAFDEPNDGYSRQLQFDPVSKSFPKSKIRKADQWLLLYRSHARLVLRAQDQCRSFMRIKKLRDEPLWRLFSRCRAADEMYFPSVLALCGELDQDEKRNDFERRRLTWCDWTKGGKSPQAYDALTADLVKTARADRCLFARKFSRGAVSDADAWESLVGPQTQVDEEPPAKRARSSSKDEEEREKQ